MIIGAEQTHLRELRGSFRGFATRTLNLGPVTSAGGDTERDPALATALDERFDAVFADLDSYHTGSTGEDFVLYTDLTKDDIKKLEVPASSRTVGQSSISAGLKGRSTWQNVG